MRVANVGIDAESLEFSKDFTIIKGHGDIISVDTNGEEYFDDLQFEYHINDGFIDCRFDECFEDDIEFIESTLIENLKTNFI